MTQREREGLIARYAEGPLEVARSLEGFSAAGLVAHPVPGKWSAREIVHHLADSESISAQRLRKLLSEENPVIHGYDQELYARRLRYNDRDHGAALALFTGVREATVPLLRSMSEDDWSRIGWHTDSGPYSADRWLEIYAAHAHDHAAQIRRLRERLASAPA